MEYTCFINDIPIENFSEEDKNELLSQCLENGLRAIGYEFDNPRKRREINWDLYRNK